MHIRRLVKSGAASHTISLPKKWLERHNLAKGDIIYIVDNGTDLTISHNKLSSNKSKELSINIDNKDINRIYRELTSAYLNNYKSITLFGKDLSKKAKDIRQILNNFVALEIDESTSTKIVARDFLDLSEISPEKIVRKMDNIVRSMFLDITNNENSSLSIRDSDINKQYFLVSRLVKASLRNEINFVEKHSALDYWYLSNNLEAIADVLKEIQPNLLIKKIESLYLDAINGYHKTDSNLGHSVLDKRLAVLKEISSTIDKNNPETISTANNLQSLLDLVCNVARVVVDQ